MFIRSFTLTIAITIPSSLIAFSPPSLATEAGFRAPTDSFLQTIVTQCGEEWGLAGAVATCIQEHDEKIGKELAAVYGDLLRRLNKKASTALRDSQRSWLKFQSSYCRAVKLSPEHEGPSIARLAEATCNLRTTVERKADLESMR